MTAVPHQTRARGGPPGHADARRRGGHTHWAGYVFQAGTVSTRPTAPTVPDREVEDSWQQRFSLPQVRIRRETKRPDGRFIPVHRRPGYGPAAAPADAAGGGRQATSGRSSPAGGSSSSPARSP